MTSYGDELHTKNLICGETIVDGNITAGATITGGIVRGQRLDTKLLTVQSYDASGIPTDQAVVIDYDEANSRSQIVFYNLPVSATGLQPGTLYNDAGTLKVA